MPSIHDITFPLDFPLLEGNFTALPSFALPQVASGESGDEVE